MKVPYYNNYLTTATLDDIREKVVASVKTSYNHSKIYIEGEPTIYVIPVDGFDPISIPNFSEQRIQQYSYEKVDVYSAAPEYDITATSAYPEVSFVSAIDEDGDMLTMTDMATQECMIVATANGIIKQLIEDNKLLYNDDTTLPFKWYKQTTTKSVTFDNNDDYRYWHQEGTLSKVSDTVLNTVAAPITVLKNTTSLNKSQTRVLASYDGNYHPLERHVSVGIDTNHVEVSKILGINIFATNSVDGKKYNVHDYYIQGNNVWVKLQNDYDADSQEVTFSITLQYFYN